MINLIYFFDTSAILNGAMNEYKNGYISPLVIQELENIKTSTTKNDYVKYLARDSVRDIINSINYKIYYAEVKKVEKFIKQNKFLSDIPDHRILSEAALLGKEKNEDINFITSDGSLYLFARIMPKIHPILYVKKEERVEWNGWNKYNPSDLQFISLYSHPEINILNAKKNEFCELFEGQELKDILFWNGEHYITLKYQNFKGYFNEKIAPRNIEQKMLFHLLQDDNIKIKLALGSFGTGKTMLMLQHALKGVREGKFEKIIFVRNNIITKGSREIGFLSGDLLQKIRPFILPLADLTSEDYLEQLLADGIIEPVPLGFLRGRDFCNCCIFVDEAENLLKENIQLLIGRVGEGSELWIAGDLKQIDHAEFIKNNGIIHLVNKLADNELFGMVKLIKSERSKTSQLADLLDN